MKCISYTKDGKACRSHARAGSEFCCFHDPATALEQQAAQSKGGSKRSKQSHLKVMPPPPFDFDLDDPRRIPKLLTFLANSVLRGELDTKVAYAVGYLADCAMRAHKAGEFTERLEQVERLQQVEHAAPSSSPSGSSTQFEDHEDGSTIKVIEDGSTVELAEDLPTIEVVKDVPAIEVVKDEPTVVFVENWSDRQARLGRTDRSIL